MTLSSNSSPTKLKHPTFPRRCTNRLIFSSISRRFTVCLITPCYKCHSRLLHLVVHPCLRLTPVCTDVHCMQQSRLANQQVIPNSSTADDTEWVSVLFRWYRATFVWVDFLLEWRQKSKVFLFVFVRPFYVNRLMNSSGWRSVWRETYGTFAARPIPEVLKHCIGHVSLHSSPHCSCICWAWLMMIYSGNPRAKIRRARVVPTDCGWIGTTHGPNWTVTRIGAKLPLMPIVRAAETSGPGKNAKRSFLELPCLCRISADDWYLLKMFPYKYKQPHNGMIFRVSHVRSKNGKASAMYAHPLSRTLWFHRYKSDRA